MHNHSDSNVNTCTYATLWQSLSRKYSNQIFPRAACPVQIRAHRHIDVYADINEFKELFSNGYFRGLETEKFNSTGNSVFSIHFPLPFDIHLCY